LIQIEVFRRKTKFEQSVSNDNENNNSEKKKKGTIEEEGRTEGRIFID